MRGMLPVELLCGDACVACCSVRVVLRVVCGVVGVYVCAFACGCVVCVCLFCVCCEACVWSGVLYTWCVERVR